MKYKIYGDIQSGNCYKIKLLMSFLQLEHEWQHIDILQGETETTAFREMNPNAKVPVLSIDDVDYLWESNAILNYLAENTPYLPDPGLPGANVLQWQCFEQYSHEPYIAVARYLKKYLGLPTERAEEYHSKQVGGHKALQVMNEHLAYHPYFVGNEITIADISLYAYTHVAEEGGFSLEIYPNIQRWLGDIQALPNYIGMGA
jgi:glutathione S-transferase